MSVVTDNPKSGKQKPNAPLPTLLYVDENLLSNPEKYQLCLVFKFIQKVGNSSICSKVFTPNRKEFPCLIERKGGTTYLTVWGNHPSSYNPSNRIIGAKSYTEFINAILLWIDKEHPHWLELLSKEEFANNLPIQSLIKSKGNENQLQDQSSTGHRRNPGGSIIDGGGAEASITVKPLSHKAILG